MKKKVIIVGGGTAGIQVACKLQDKFDVEILDSGVYKKIPTLYRFPLAIGYLFQKKVNPYFDTVPVQYEKKRKIPYVVSRVFGGASEINGAVHVFGSNKAWQPILEKFELKIKKLTSIHDKLFEKSLKNIFFKTIKYRKAPSGRVEYLLAKLLRKKGFEEIDSRWQDKPGFGAIFNNCGAFTRSSVLNLLPNKIFQKFKVRKNVKVKEIIIENGVAIGVKTKGKSYFSDYVILCAGTIGTNEIMLRSKQSNRCLDRLKIGENIKDHVSLRLNYFANIGVESINVLKRSMVGKIACFVSHIFQKPSLLSGTGATLAIHWSSNNTKKVDCRINVLRFSEPTRQDSAVGELDIRPGISISFTPIYPKSFGEIYLNINNELQIRPNYLKHKSDKELLKKAIIYMQKLLGDQSLNSLKLEKCEKMSQGVENFIKENIYSGHHLIGGMHQNVNKDFSIKGIKNLYICDGSIFGSYPSSNIHSSILILATYFSEKFISEQI